MLPESLKVFAARYEW